MQNILSQMPKDQLSSVLNSFMGFQAYSEVQEDGRGAFAGQSNAIFADGFSRSEGMGATLADKK